MCGSTRGAADVLILIEGWDGTRGELQIAK